jgi:hypothetical protein
MKLRHVNDLDASGRAIDVRLLAAGNRRNTRPQ